LHGDLTESNVIVAENKVVGILDWELASIGPAEYDISKAILFCWFRMNDVPLDEKGEKHTFQKVPLTKVYETALAHYNAQLSVQLLQHFLVLHQKRHAEEILRNKDNYADEKWWNMEREFAEKAREEIAKNHIKERLS